MPGVDIDVRGGACGVPRERGYALAVLLVGIAIMMILLTVAMPVWHQAMQREKEEELIFRGMQYARAVNLYQRKFGAGYPPSVDFLVQQHFLRKKFKDPMVADGEFQLVPPGAIVQTGRAGATTGQMQGQSNRFSQSSTTLGVTAGRGNVIGGFVGVVSKSTAKSIRLYNGRDHYNEWLFAYTAQTAGRSNVGGRGTGGQGPGRGGRGPGQ